jgi:hypothetical protein
MKTKLTKKGRGVGSSKSSSQTEERLEEILDEEIEKVPGPKQVDKREEMKESYVEFLNENLDKAEQAYVRLSMLSEKEFGGKELSQLTDAQKRLLKKYTEDAILLRSYLNTSDLLFGLNETERIPEKVQKLNIQIVLLYVLFPSLTMLGSQSPEEGENIKEAMLRMRLMSGLDFNPMILTEDQVKSKAMNKFVEDLKRVSPVPKEMEGEIDGGRKSRTRRKRRKSFRKSRGLKKRRKTRKGKKNYRKRRSVKKK